MVPAGSEHLAAGAARAVRWVDRDPATIPDVDLPSIAAAQWIADLLSDLRSDLAVRVVRPGVRLLGSTTPPLPGTRLRIFTDHAEILAGMSEPHERARTLEEAHVALTLAPSMSRWNTPQRRPEIATLVPGRDEIIEHGHNGLLVEPDDPRGAARLLDLVAKDRALLERLTDGAGQVYDAWPAAEQHERELKAAADEIGGAPPAMLQAPPIVPPPHGARQHARVERPRLRRWRERLG